MPVVELDKRMALGLWTAIRGRLDNSLPNWSERIDGLGQVVAVERRVAGVRWPDDDVLEALIRAVLGNNTDWSKVEGVLPEFKNLFSGFSLRTFAEMSDEDVDRELVPWFKLRKAGSMTMAGGLKGLVRTARLLSEWSAGHGSAESYFLEAIAEASGDGKRAAIALGKAGSRRKLPALGVPIAAEGLRSLGFDLSKPDRHLCRAVGSFHLVHFHNWPDATGTKPPRVNMAEQLETMAVVEAMAQLVGERTTLVDNAIWLLCSKAGLHLPNFALVALAADATAHAGRWHVPPWVERLLGSLLKVVLVGLRGHGSVVSRLCQLPRKCPNSGVLRASALLTRVRFMPSHTHSPKLARLSGETPFSMAFRRSGVRSPSAPPTRPRPGRGLPS